MSREKNRPKAHSIAGRSQGPQRTYRICAIVTTRQEFINIIQAPHHLIRGKNVQYLKRKSNVESMQ
jgi:hypothetical protein